MANFCESPNGVPNRRARLRRALPRDCAELARLVSEHASWEGVGAVGLARPEELAAILFGSTPQIECLVAEAGGHVQGYATFMVQYATWTGKPYLHLDCLYLRAPLRGRGVGRAILERLRDLAIRRGCQELQWQTPCENHGAIGFYRHMGARRLDKARFFLNAADRHPVRQGPDRIEKGNPLCA